MRSVCALAMVALLLLSGCSLWAANWTRVGTSGFVTDPEYMLDYKNVVINSLVADDAGNIYATANNANNDGAPGGVTIFKVDGTTVNIDVNAAGLPGAITKLVKAGDGRIYGLQNWCDIQEGADRGVPYRIIRINPDATVEEIVSITPLIEGWQTDMADANPHVVDLGGGNKGVTLEDIGAGYDEYWVATEEDDLTLAARFRIDSYSGTGIMPMQLMAGGLDSPIVGLQISNGRFELFDIWAGVQLKDLGPADNQFHEAFLYVDGTTAGIRLIWDGVEVYSGTSTEELEGPEGFVEWGTSTYWGPGGTCVITYDWVGYGPGFIDTQSSEDWTLFLDCSELPTAEVVNRFGGMTVGGDGNLYYTMNSGDDQWKNHFFWRYNVYSGEVEESPTAGVDNGWSEPHRMFDLEYVGDDLFAVVGGSDSMWGCTPISWTMERQEVLANQDDPGFGRQWTTALAYDPVRRKMWAGGRSEVAKSFWDPFLSAAGDDGAIVDLGGGNKGLQFVDPDDESYAQYAGQYDTIQTTFALKFRIDAIDTTTPTRIMQLYGSGRVAPDGTPVAIGVDIVDNRYVVIDILGDEQVADIGPADIGVWHEIYAYVDSEADIGRLAFDGVEVYNGPLGEIQAPDWYTWPEFGAGIMSGTHGGTMTATFDWFALAWEYRPPGTQPTDFDYFFDGSKLWYELAQVSNIMCRWNGSINNPTLFDRNSYKVESIDQWHANGYDEVNNPIPNVSNGGHYWISALAVNPADGQAWVAWGGEPSYHYDATDRVRTIPVHISGTTPPLGDEGVPEPGAQVVGLYFHSGKVYALTCNLTTGVYSLYKADAPEPGLMNIGQMKQWPAGVVVETDSPKLVTWPLYSFLETSFYILDENRASGIRVVPAIDQPMAQVGDRVQLSGYVDVKDGEAVIYATQVTVSPTSDVLQPFAMPARSIGGGQTGPQPVTYMGDETPGTGVNTTGLLVRVAGRLKQLSYDDEYIDDGSGYPVKLDWIDGTGGTDGDQIIVTGVSSVIWDGVRAYRCIKPRTFDDIQLNP